MDYIPIYRKPHWLFYIFVRSSIGDDSETEEVSSLVLVFI